MGVAHRRLDRAGDRRRAARGRGMAYHPCAGRSPPVPRRCSAPVFLLGGPGDLQLSGRPRSDPCGGTRIFQRDLRRRAGLLAARRAHQRGAGDRTGRHPGLRLCRRRVLHIALVPQLVFGLGPVPSLGITGAGLCHGDLLHRLSSRGARVVSRVEAGRRSPLSLRGFPLRAPPCSARSCRVGAPMSLAPLLNNVALATLTTYAGAAGRHVAAAFGAAVQLEYLLYPLNFALGAGGARHGRQQHRCSPVHARRAHRLDRGRTFG